MPYNDNIYILNFKRLVVWLLPTPMRKAVTVLWLMALIKPVVKLYDQFIAFRKSVLYRLSITPQVCYLEKLLNDKYDASLRRITIVDSIEFNALPLYRKQEVKPIRLYRKSEATEQVLYTKSETGIFTVDFIIRVPLAVAFDYQELRSLVNTYKLVSKKFKVQMV